MRKIALSCFFSLCFIQVGVGFLFASNYHFADSIDSYPINSRYSDHNAHVRLLTDNGGNPVIQTTIGNFSTSGADRMLEVNSGTYGQYTYHGAGTKSAERYGQLFYRVGKSSKGANWVMCTLYDENHNSGPVVLMDVNGLYRYYNSSQEIITSKNYSLTNFEGITINYDLQLKTYDVWIGTENLVSGARFNNAGTFTIPDKMVIGGAWWTEGVSAALDQWYWKVSDETAFTSYGSSMVNVVTTPAPFFINLGDYAKGDGSDETEAIQRAVNALPPANYKEHVTADHPGGVLYIPRPKNFYGISQTVKVVERWNSSIICESPVAGTRGMPRNYYFRWIGPDNGVIFQFNSCKGMTVENLTLNGMDQVGLDRMVTKDKHTPIGRHTQGVTGILIGPENLQGGFQTNMIFDNLKIGHVAIGIKLGDYPNNGPDVREFTFRNAVIADVSKVGIIAASGNLANITFETLTIGASEGAECAIRLDGGEMLILNYNSSGENVKDADVVVNAGGIQIVKAWSEWWGPFFRTGTGYPEWTAGTYGSIFFPIILEGVRHYEGRFFVNTYPASEEGAKGKSGKNPVPLSVIYNKQVPLHLIGCSFWGAIELGAESMATILDYGTVFIDKNCIGFTGEGATKYGRVIHIGTRHPQNSRILEPYVVDRRSVPGAGPPSSGVWQKGDRINNIDPDESDQAKAWGGWICVEGGEPGRWVPFGKLK